MAANTVQSRRRPWPYDAYIGVSRVMLVPNDDGQLVGRKTRTLDQSAPVTFEYGDANPFKERTFPWIKLFSGMGQSIAPGAGEAPRRYYYAQNADCSIDGLWMKGPNFEDHIETVNAAAGEVRQIVKALHGGVEVVFAICENGVYRRTADGTWVASLTAGTGPALPAGQFPQQAVRFKHRGVSPVDALYLGTATGNIWQYNGAAWTQAAAGAGPGDGVANGECRYINKIGDELWVGGDKWVVKCEDDPMLRASYSAVIWIGDQTCNVTWLSVVDNTLYIFKADGVYTVSKDGIDQELFPTLRGRLNTRNGRNATVWIDQMWVPFGGKTYRLTADGQLTPDGLEQLLDNTSEVRGEFVAGAGHNTWFFYEVYYNSQSGNSYLVKHGSWVDDGSGRSIQFLSSAHHGSLASWGKRATCAEIVADIHPSGNDRLYVGFADGTVEWCVLPKNGPNPAADANCEFTADDSYVYLPTHHSNFQADTKLYRGNSIFGPHLTNNEWAEIQYRLDVANRSASWDTLTPDEGTERFTVPGQRKDHPNDRPIYGRAIQFRVKLVKDADIAVSPKNLTPVIEGLMSHEQIRPSLSLEYTFHINASSVAVKRNGTIVRQRGDALREAIFTQMGEAGSTLIRLPNGSSQEMTLVDYEEAWTPAEKRRDLESVLTVTAIQLATLTPATGPVGLTYATLEQYTHGQLESLL